MRKSNSYLHYYITGLSFITKLQEMTLNEREEYKTERDENVLAKRADFFITSE